MTCRRRGRRRWAGKAFACRRMGHMCKRLRSIGITRNGSSGDFVTAGLFVAEDDDFVAAALFGELESLLGAGDEICAGGAGGGESETAGDAEGGAAAGEGVIGDGAAEAAGHDGGALQIDAGSENHKLFAA